MTLRPAPQAQAGELIASAILAKDGPGPAAGRQRSTPPPAILSGYAAGGYLSTSPQPG